MPTPHAKMMTDGYRSHCAWMLNHAAEYEQGVTLHMTRSGGQMMNDSLSIAADFRHRAGNLHALIIAYERWDAKPH